MILEPKDRRTGREILNKELKRINFDDDFYDPFNELNLAYFSDTAEDDYSEESYPWPYKQLNISLLG